MSNPTIGIIGAGAIGSAVGKRLAPVATVNYWDIDRSLRTTGSLDTLAQASDIILICTPSPTNRALAQAILQATPASGHHPAVVSLAKGVEPGFVTVDRILSDVLGHRYVTGVLSGPMIAAEIAAGLTPGATIATTGTQATISLSRLLQDAGFTVQASSDTASTAACGALKNVYSLALGLADGLSLGSNHKSTITVLAATEMSEILSHLGLDSGHTYALCGLGDLITTGFSGASYNWKVGRDQGRGVPQRKGEGINTLSNLSQAIPVQQFPLLHILTAIFLNGADPAALTALPHAIPSPKNELKTRC